MDKLPVEIVGKILSCLGSARDVVRASFACRKWREAAKNHLHTLSFQYADGSFYRELSASSLEILITQTIFQTNRLQNLSICMGDSFEFSAAPVIAWLMYTRETLRSLVYMVRSKPSLCILEKCGKQKLETLVLGHTIVSGVEPSYQRFPCLKSLSLHCVSISGIELMLLLTICPKLESLSLVNPDLTVPDVASYLELSNPSLKNVYMEELSLDKLILEADNLESLHLKETTIELFEVISKGNLKHLKFQDVTLVNFEMGETMESLEVVDVSSFTLMWPKFHQMILKSVKLKRLRIWDLMFDVEDEVMDLETIATSFPKLSSLALSYDLSYGLLQFGLKGSSLLENVTILELGSIAINDLFSQWIAAVLERCPRLKQVIIHGNVSEAKLRDDYRILSRFTSSIVSIMRTFADVDVQFEFQ
ncbi:hypothetical protein SUGI_1194670 [Cryptomeria japonica]|uniref:F-box/LRR-repeat protein At1g67190 n=1 Tax=Cryptomeria japonica TaxID=3369 RepID=UPI0024147DB3|nr:F-box/LRR-repeat protein At1g67190 [Cryptomeria japonica]GLJ55629.1 hypothetical protein SUGI_1194670 [Cryptomeria japonica]